MYTYKLGGMLITDELYHDDLETMTFGRKDQNELMHYGIKGQSWGKRRFQNEDGSLTMAGRNRYDVGDPLQGSTNRAMAANRTYAAGGGTGGFGGASGGGGSAGSNRAGRNTNIMSGGGTLAKPGSSTVRYSFPGKPPFSSEGPGQSAGRASTNKVKASVNNSVNSGKKAVDNLFGHIGNALKPVAKSISDATEFVTGSNATRRVENAAKAYDQASRDMLANNRSWVAGTNGSNMEKDAENLEAQSRLERLSANLYDQSAKNRNLFDFDGKDADRYQRDQHEAEAKNLATQANDLRSQIPKEYEADYRKLEEADRNLRAAEKAREENTLGGVVGNVFNNAKNWVGDRARDVGNAATNAYNDVSKAAGDATQWVGDRANDVGNWAGNAAKDVGTSVTNAANQVGDTVAGAAKDVGNWASNAASDVRDWGAGAIDKGKTAVSNFFSDLVNPHYNLNASDMKSRYEERLAELPKGDIARIRYYGNSQGDEDALREQARESIKRGR